MKRRLLDCVAAGTIAAVLLGLGQAVWLAAAPVTIPYSFSAGQTLPAPRLNANFAALATGINSITSDQIVDGTLVAADLATAAVTTPKLADNIPGSKLADQAITTAKLATGSTIASYASANPTANQTVTATPVTVATLPTVITRGGRVMLGGTIAWHYVSADDGLRIVTFQITRDGAARGTWDYEVSGTLFQTIALPTPFFIDDPVPAGSHVYRFTAVINSSASVVKVNANPGQVFALELG